MNRLRALVGLALLLPGLAGSVETVNGIRAIVADAVITHHEVESFAAQPLEQLRRQYRDKPEEFFARRGETLRNALDQLVQRQLILADFKTAGYNLPESLIQDEIERVIRERFQTRSALVKTLQAEGTTLEEYRRQVREQFIIRALSHKYVASELIISPYKIETYYQNHRDRFKVDEQVKLRMIVLDQTTAASAEGRRRLAQDLLAQIRQGADFADLARTYSAGSQRREGGLWGWVERSVLNPTLAEVAFALSPGQVSEVIETPDACFLMLVEDKRPAQYKALSDVRDEIERTLLLEEQARLRKQWMDRLRAKTFVKEVLP